MLGRFGPCKCTIHLKLVIQIPTGEMYTLLPSSFLSLPICIGPAPALNSPSNCFSPVLPRIVTEPSNFPSYRVFKNIWEKPAKSHELLPCRLPSSKHFGSIVPYRHRINPCDSCLQMTNVSKTHSKTVTCWHLLAERLCTNTASVTLSPKPVSIIDLSDLEPESTVLARAKENPPGRSRNHLCLEQVNVDKLPIPSWNLTLVRVLALAVSHAVQKPLTLWRTCTPAGNKLVCSVSYILHPC